MPKNKKQTKKDKIVAYLVVGGAMVAGFSVGYIVVKTLVLAIFSN